MTDLEKFSAWIRTFPNFPENLSVDFTSALPNTAGLFPSGLVEVERSENVLGDTTVVNRYNFALYYTTLKDGGDESALQSAEWVMALQLWVQSQSVRKLSPTFGNTDENKERIKAENGAFFENPDTGEGMYVVQISVTFKNFYEG